MDAKHMLSANPLRPAYDRGPAPRATPAAPVAWRRHSGGLVEICHEGEGFAFDNEGPRHKVWLEPFALADRLVTNGEWLAFMAAGGYGRPEFWLSEGWARVRDEAWRAPAYWQEVEGAWMAMPLHGLRPLDLAAPVAHLSYYEADAYAAWAGARLPTEAE